MPTWITFEDLEPVHCRFPRGDKPPYRFCGKDRQHGSSYCPNHARQCSNGVPDRNYYLLKAEREKEAA
jgi:hypothetical protein